MISARNGKVVLQEQYNGVYQMKVRNDVTRLWYQRWGIPEYPDENVDESLGIVKWR